MTTKIFHEIKLNRQENLISCRLSSVFSLILVIALLTAFSSENFAQTKKSKTKAAAPKVETNLNLPKVTQINEAALKDLLKPNGKPLLINFWATWCDPCREEFPDLVKIGADYKDKINLMTISLDDLAEIDNDVPKFLAQMKSAFPAYLLKVPDEGAAIATVSKDWQGGLPFTILFDADGKAVYEKQGKFNTAFLRNEIDKVLNTAMTTVKTQANEK